MRKSAETARCRPKSRSCFEPAAIVALFLRCISSDDRQLALGEGDGDSSCDDTCDTLIGTVCSVLSLLVSLTE